MARTRHIPGSYKSLELTAGSVAHEIDADHDGDTVFCFSDVLVHVRFGDATVETSETDPPVLPTASATVDDVATLPKALGATHIAVLAPGGSGDLKLWLGKAPSR